MNEFRFDVVQLEGDWYFVEREGRMWRLVIVWVITRWRNLKKADTLYTRNGNRSQHFRWRLSLATKDNNKHSRRKLHTWTQWRTYFVVGLRLAQLLLFLLESFLTESSLLFPQTIALHRRQKLHAVDRRSPVDLKCCLLLCDMKYLCAILVYVKYRTTTYLSVISQCLRKFVQNEAGLFWSLLRILIGCSRVSSWK